MEYTSNDIQTARSIGSIKERWHNASAQFILITPQYDSFNFICFYTLRLRDSVKVTSYDGYTQRNDKYRRLGLSCEAIGID